MCQQWASETYSKRSGNFSQVFNCPRCLGQSIVSSCGSGRSPGGKEGRCSYGGLSPKSGPVYEEQGETKERSRLLHVGRWYI